MPSNSADFYQPLAVRLRPKQLDEFVGQNHLLGDRKPLREAIRLKIPHSMVLWGPPGTGKTTLAKLIASEMDLPFESISAVLSGVKEIRQAIDKAIQTKALGKNTLLFVDEVHRFNKSQQDAFLPYIEDGTIVFIGATTENPSFELNKALLSRTRVYVLKVLDDDELGKIIDRALSESTMRLSNDCKIAVIHAADGDARRALNLLEQLGDFLIDSDQNMVNDLNLLKSLLQKKHLQFDKQGDIFYEQISALHKSVRGSSPDAALYWLVRMLEGGCDPLYIARRLIRMASEDIGNADPRALQISLDAWNAYERLGSPEGELMLAQAIIYCACAPKSNAVYAAYKSARTEAKQRPSYDVPMHLRNAPTELMKDLGYGKKYRYAHDEQGYAAGENYFPEEMQGASYYSPKKSGLEIKISEKLAQLKQQDLQAPIRRYHDNNLDTDTKK